ncbi:hypothetical protein [Aliarcobacter butzleri]|uniref:hypothetical protein n=1 Tax=Aliarcobacter TaxID=2321111 RepID=UPI00263C3D26|nr:hypothetical protein [Aliarcobacter butzleri]MDN5060717.1 hypothetical protein [Aliarcobacter butzleri]
MEQTISLNLTRNSVQKFSEVFNSLETLDTKNIDILIIVSIKNKLKICLLSLEEKEFTIYFTKDEFVVLKILSNQYLTKKNLKKPKSNLNNDFDKYLDKKNK